MDIAAEAHAVVESSGPLVSVHAIFDRLRLDYPILRDIPLEGIANSALGNKPLYVYGASKLVAVVPVLESKFTVGAILLPNSGDSIDVGVTLRQIWDRYTRPCTYGQDAFVAPGTALAGDTQDLVTAVCSTGEPWGFASVEAW